MSNTEDILQKYIDALEQGKSLDQILAEVPEEYKDIEPLLRLTAALRETEQPHPSPEHIRTDKMALLEEAKSFRKTTKVSRSRFRLPVRPFFAGVLALVFIFAIISFGALIFLQGPQAAHAATLTGITGLVEVYSQRTGSTWKMVEGGDQIGEGAMLRTDASSSATLIFYDGSRVVLDSNTTISLANVEGNWTRQMQITIDQASGKTYHNVVPRTSKNGQYEVNTPSATASAKGTKFVVGVEQNGRTRISVRSGAVRLSKNSTAIELLAGQALTATPEGSLENPAYQFTIHGLFDLNESEEPTVSGMKIEVSEKTSVSGNPTDGDYVDVEGRILDTGEWVADEIELADQEEIQLTYSGVINVIGETAWQVGDTMVEIDENTQISEGVDVGSVVDVTFAVQEDGSQLAKEIEAIEVAPNPTALPSLVFPVEEMKIPGCDPEFIVPATLINEATGENDFASGVELGYTIEKDNGFINSVTLEPSSWDQIGPGGIVDFSVHINLSDWTDTNEGTEIKIRVFVAEETNRPDHLNGRLTITLISTCEGEPYPGEEEELLPTETITPTETVTPTETITPTESITPTETITSTESVNLTTPCVGADPHPTAVKLSRTYNVSEDEIMGWFCDGFGFGEIDLAYSISQQSIKTTTGIASIGVADIFELRRSGVGWGDIKSMVESNTVKNSKEKIKTANPNKPEKTKEAKE